LILIYSVQIVRVFFFFGSVNFCLLSSSQLAVLSFFSRWQVWRLGGGGADDLQLLLVATAVGFAAGGRRRCCTGRGSRGWSVVEVDGEGIDEVRKLLNLQ
jgi:hypothetical protein